MRNFKVYLILLAITIIGGFFRFYKLPQYPVSLSIDEAAVGYNAYSILKTGHDEYGKFLPLSFKSVGDYKPPFLIYLIAPSLAIFGLNEFGVRFPIALIGILTIPLVYFLVKRLFKNDLISLLTCFSLSISPWHIQCSRGSFEAVLALFFLIAGIFFFFGFVKGRSIDLIFAVLFFVLSVYTYHSEKIVTPMIILSLFVIYRKNLLSGKKYLLVSLILGAFLLIPFVYQLFGPEGKTRAMMTFISRDNLINSELHKKDEKLGFLSSILDNNFLIVSNFWFKRYLNYFDPKFLFFDGMKLTLPGQPGIGLLHLYELLPFFTGLILLFFKSNLINKKEKYFLFFWWLVGPLAASLANNDQHALRSLTTIPIPQLFVGLGICEIVRQFLGGIRKIIFFAVSIIIVGLSLIFYADLYFVHFPAQFSEYFDYGMKEASLFAWQNEKKYEEIIFDPVFGTSGPDIVGTPYLYVLFFGKYDPYLYQNDPRHRLKGDSTNFYKFTFRSIYWPTDRFKKNSLFIGSPWSLPKNDLKDTKVLKEIPFKNNAIGFYIVETK